MKYGAVRKSFPGFYRNLTHEDNMIAPKILNINSFKNIKLYVQNELKFKYKTPSQEHHT